MNKPPLSANRQALAWASYDWANSAFATTIMVGFFPVFFKQYWANDMAAEESTFWLGVGSSAYALIVAMIAPLLGSIADASNSHKKFLASQMILGASMSAGLFWVGSGQWQAAMIVYGLGAIGFALGNVFYDSLITRVATPQSVDRVSTLGYSLGYLGGGLLFLVNVLMVAKPQWFGISDPALAVRIAFLMVGVWWLLFSLPVFLFVGKDESYQTVPGRNWLSGVRELRNTFREIRKLRTVWLFLLAYFLYIDGVNTITKMAVDFGLSLGFSADKLMMALLLVQFIAFPATLLSSRLADYASPKIALFIALGVYVLATGYGYFMQDEWQFFVLAGMIGLAIGVVPALSRSMFSRLIPPGKSGEFFGFYGMFGRFAAVLGPVLVGWVTLSLGNPRLGILSINILLFSGAALLLLVKIPERQSFEVAGDIHV